MSLLPQSMMGKPFSAKKGPIKKNQKSCTWRKSLSFLDPFSKIVSSSEFLTKTIICNSTT